MKLVHSALIPKIGIKSNNKKIINITGRLGFVKKKYGGKDAIFLKKIKNKIFFLSQISFKNFISLLRNQVKGITTGYFIEMKLVGLGYYFIKFNSFILFKLGLAHYIKYNIKPGCHIIGYRKKLIIFGIDLEEINSLINLLESFKKPDNYKGKGIVIEDKKILLKIGKQK